MSEIPVSTPIENPIKKVAKETIVNIFKTKNFEEYVPLQTGFLFWKKNYFLNETTPGFEDLKKELLDKGYEVRYYPYNEMAGDCMYNYAPENTKIKVKPSENGKTVIIIDNDI